MEHDERMANRQYEYEKYKMDTARKYEYKKHKLTIYLIVGVVLFYILYFGEMRLYSGYQEQKLKNLVEEIQEDINNKKFDEAYIKAQSIVYTSGWSDELEEKWDNIRKEVIDRIIKAEKKETGKTTHKRETDGIIDEFFSLFD